MLSTDANANGIPDECDTNLPPFIIEQPVDRNVCVGETVVFTVQPGGMPPFSYQWRKDTVDLTGETADTLSLPDVTTADAGDYDVLVTNDLGTTASQAATLAILTVAPDLLPDPDGIPRNRYLSFVPSEASCVAAIRVRLISLQHPDPPNAPGRPPLDYSAYEAASCSDSGGCIRWVGEPSVFVEIQDLPAWGTFQAARLQCTPLYRDWSSVGLISVTGAEIVPSSLYELDVVPIECQGAEDTCATASNTLEIATARWGDIALPRNPPPAARSPRASISPGW